MKETGKRRTPNNVQSKRTAKTERRNNKPCQENNGKGLNAKERVSKASNARPGSGNSLSDSSVGPEPAEAYENMVVHYVDDDNRSKETGNGMASKVNEDVNLDDHSSDMEKVKEEEFDSETTKDSSSSQGEDEKIELTSGILRSTLSKNSSDSSACGSRMISEAETDKAIPKELNNIPKNSSKFNAVPPNSITKIPSDKITGDWKVPPAHSLESSGGDEKHADEVKEIDVLDEESNGIQSIGSDNDIVDTEENLQHEDEAVLNEKIEEMEMRIEKLEEELREVAALEISLYSVVPEHGSSAHKVHTPARRLSRVYIYAGKHWTQNKRGTIAKNTVSGLILIAKSCGNDVSRLTFWLSNTIVLREIISQAFGSSHNSSLAARFPESNGNSKRNEVKPMPLKWRGGVSNKQVHGYTQFVEDWQDTGTFLAALEKVESWIFSRIVESVWWQALTPHMQPPVEGLSPKMAGGKVLGPALGDQQQGNFSINLWKNAFKDAFQRLCPVRAGGHECGCLPVLARMVMEQCVARLDVAMFNAILRESAHEIPTDPVSDPILDSRVLPIPAGDLSFGSGAQLKNSIGNWSRWLIEELGISARDTSEEDHHNSDNDVFRQVWDGEPKSFHLLNELSDLLMLPKDMLMDRSIRQEVCPSIGLQLVKRILCNFTPDEFCPDAVQGAVLEALNAESIIERRLSSDSARTFPYSAAPVTYAPPSSVDVAEKVAEAGATSQFSRNVSLIQRKGYTSDEELEELDSPLVSIIDKLPPSPTIIINGKSDRANQGDASARYELLREVWSA